MSPEAKNTLELLRLDFVSEFLDQSVHMIRSHLKRAQEDERSIVQIVGRTKLADWSETSRLIQERCLVLRQDDKGVLPNAVIIRGSSKPVFGAPLSSLQLVPAFGIPPILLETTHALLTNPGALDCEGLFRLSASVSRINKFVAAYDSGQNVVLKDEDPIVIAAVLKKWARDLPEPLISAKESVVFSSTISDRSSRNLVASVKKIVLQLPELNRRCVHRLMETAYHVAMHQAQNMMTPNNLGVVLGPLLSKREDGGATVAINQMSSMNELVVIFITSFNEIFGPFI